MEPKDIQQYLLDLDLDGPTEKFLITLFRVKTRGQLFSKFLELNRTGEVTL